MFPVLLSKIMRIFEVLAAVGMSMLVFLVVSPCGLVGRHQLLKYILPLSSGMNEAGGSIFFRNVST